MSSQEFTPDGDRLNPKAPEPLGTYVDPASGKSLRATHPAQADAFIKMGWKFQEPRPHMADTPGQNPDEALRKVRERARELGVSYSDSDHIQSLRMRIGKAEKALAAKN